MKGRLWRSVAVGDFPYMENKVGSLFYCLSRTVSPTGLIHVQRPDFPGKGIIKAEGRVRRLGMACANDSGRTPSSNK